MSNLQHIKGSRTRVLKTFPTKTFGKDGDIVISRINGKGVFLCSKAGGMWYAANKMQELNKLEKTSIRELTTNKLTVNKMINTERSTDRFVVNDGGSIKYRTGEQVVGDLPLPFNNIDYKTAYCSLGQYPDKDSCESNGGTWYYSENDSHDSISSTAENQLLTVGQSIGGVDAESTLTYDGSILEIKRNTDYDDNWQTATTTNLLKLSYDSSNNAIFDINSSGDLTLDADGDIELNADGGDITFKDASADLAALSSSGLTISNILEIGSDTDKILMSDSGIVKYVDGATLRGYIGAGTSSVDALDDLSDVTYSSGDLTISSLDTIVTGNCLWDSSGKIELDSTNASNGANDGLIFKTAGTTIGALTSHHSITSFTLYEAGGSSTDDYFSIVVDEHGATLMSTVDDNAAVADLKIDIDGDIELESTGTMLLDASSDIVLDSGGNCSMDSAGGRNRFLAAGTAFAELQVDGTSNLVLYEQGGASSDDRFVIACATNGVTTIATVDAAATAGHLFIRPDGNLVLDPVSQKTIISATDGLYFDDGLDTYITESASDVLAIYVGDDIMMQLTEGGADGNTLLFRTDTSVGFTRNEATFSATGIIGSGGTDDTDIDFRFSNKFRLEMTGDITTINLIFPAASGNFLLVCTTNGDHDVTNWKTWESDESAATTTDVLWAGGSVPAFTSSGVDVVSFYWDAAEQQAYGVASLAFATP